MTKVPAPKGQHTRTYAEVGRGECFGGQLSTLKTEAAGGLSNFLINIETTFVIIPRSHIVKSIQINHCNRI